jgi:hypothetical protein
MGKRKRILFKNDKNYEIDAIVDVLPDQRFLVKWLEDDKLTSIPIDTIIKYEDAPEVSTLKDE